MGLVFGGAVYIHKENGNEYRAMVSNLKVKIDGQWREDFVLYYQVDNPLGQLYSRSTEEFLKSFRLKEYKSE